MKKQKITSQDRLINHIRDTARKEQTTDQKWIGYFETIWDNNPETKGEVTINKMMWEAYKYGQQSDYIAGKEEGKKEALDIINEIPNPYPTDIFPELTKEELKYISRLLENADRYKFTLDRLSAHIMRTTLNNFKEYFKGKIDEENNNANK